MIRNRRKRCHIDGELKGEYGFVFSKLVIDAKKRRKNKC